MDVVFRLNGTLMENKGDMSVELNTSISGWPKKFFTVFDPHKCGLNTVKSFLWGYITPKNYFGTASLTRAICVKKLEWVPAFPLYPG
jgi:hypothetical protein